VEEGGPVNEVFTLKLSAVQVLGLAAWGVAMGIWLKRRLPILDRLNIPASIAGGLVYAVIALALRDRYLNLAMDMVLRDILMIMFFTTIGMSASLRLVREGGVQVVWFFVIATVGAVLQNVVGIAGARLFGLDPLLGIISGSVALTGGPATALAFGGTFEQMGIAGATTLGIASATFGITAGGLMGGAIGARLIRHYQLAPRSTRSQSRLVPAAGIVYAGSPDEPEALPLKDERESEESPLLNNVVAIAISMGIGSVISLWFQRLGLVLPGYVGAMIAAGIVRNLDDRFHFARVSQAQVDTLGNIALYLFIVMALMDLRLWELVSLALPLMAMLLLQIALVWLMCWLLSFRLMGKDYEAAVMAGGFCGFMLGTTANAMACMDVLVQKFGPAPRAFIVVPLVGAFLIDFTNALVITAMANLLR
jgi:ESS family glutamate:Na+ symporter